MDLLCVIRLTNLDQVTKAIIGKPAPAFSGTSVLNGEFKELKLSDYLGNFLHLVLYFKLCLLKYSFYRKVPGFLLLPAGLYLCLSHRDPRLQRQGGRVQGTWRRGWC